MSTTNITGVPEGQIQTSIKDMGIIDYTFAVNNSLDYASFLRDKGKITEEELNNIINMLRSEDTDNFEVALLVLEQLGK